jgi:hypothetical protein
MRRPRRRSRSPGRQTPTRSARWSGWDGADDAPRRVDWPWPSASEAPTSSALSMEERWNCRASSAATQLGFQFGRPRRQGGDLRRQRGDQRIFLCMREVRKVGSRSDLKRPWRARRRAGPVGLRIHDLRHTFAPIGAGANLGLPIVEKLFGLAQPQTTARYARLDVDPLVRPANLIGAQLKSAFGAKPTSDF